VTQRSTECHRDYYTDYTVEAITSKTGGEAIVFFTLHNSATEITASLYFSGKSEGSLISSLMLIGNPDSSSNSAL